VGGGDHAAKAEGGRSASRHVQDKAPKSLRLTDAVATLLKSQAAHGQQDVA